jgi:NAD(P)-dependent dehydrogenase (short-subunit alcohol dehydrogenase family)
VSVVLVTGASSGIGRATAHRLAARGHDLVLAARGKGTLEDTVAECRRLGSGSATAVAHDVRDAAAVDALVETVIAEHGRLDAVVHAAAVVAYGQFTDVPGEIFDAVLDTNVRGSANVARAVLPVFRRRGCGHLVLLGSVLGDMAAPGMTPYAVTKWAVRSLGRQLALENRDQPDVHVTVVSPGPVDTPIYRQAANYEGRPGRPPFPVVTPEYVARAIVEVLDRPRDRVSVGPANRVMKLGFSLLPKVFDSLVGPLIRVMATRPGHLDATPGNVLEPREELEAVRGGENQGFGDLFARLRGR